MAPRNAINVLIKLLGGPEMVNELEKLGKSGEKAFKEIEGAANKVSLARLGGSLNEFGKSFAQNVRFAATAVTGLVAVATAAAPAVILLANAGARAADEVGKAAQATGLQTEAFQKFQFAAEKAEVSQQQFVSAMSKFGQEVTETANKVEGAGKKISGAFSNANRDIQQGVGSTTESFKTIGVQVTRFGEEVDKAGKKAAKGANETSSAFVQLGIKVKDAAGKLKNNEQLLLEVANAFQKMPDGARKSAIAVDLFGQAGARLIPFLNNGAEGIKRLSEEAESLGIIFTDEQIRAAQKYNDAMNSLRRAAVALRNQIGLVFVPALTQAANAFRDVILRNRDAILSFAEGAIKRAVVLVKDLILALSGDDANVENKWILEWRDAIIQFGKDFVAVVQNVILPAIDALIDAAELAADGVNSVFGTNISAGQVALTTALVGLAGGFMTVWKGAVAATEAIAFFSRVLLANPWLAAIAAVGGGILLWATRTDAATAALREHQGIVDEVKAAYDKVGGSVRNLTRDVIDGLIIKTRDALKDLVPAFEAEMEKLRQAAAAPAKENPFSQALRDFAAGGALEDYIKAVKAIGAANPDLNDAAIAFLDMTTRAQELNSQIVPLNTYMQELTSSAAGIDAAKPLENIAPAAEAATQKVQELSKQITVTRFGEQGLTKETFDLVDGIAKRSSSAQTSLEGVGRAATAAGQEVLNVSNEITNSVTDAVPPDAAAAPVDQVVSDVQRIAPAAEQAAAETNAALSDIGNVDVGAGASNVAQAILQPFEDLQSRISVIFNNIRQVAQSGFQSIAALVSQLARQIEAEINRILAALRRAAAEAARLRAQASRSSGSGKSGGPGLAGGGPVHGKGGPRSDSNLRWLSNGEFVVQAAAVRKLGLRALYAINRGIIPDLSKIKGMADGGFVGDILSGLQSRFDFSQPFAELAVARSSNARPFTLVLSDGRVINGLTADESAVDQMQRFSLTASMLSAGRKPGRGK